MRLREARTLAAAALQLAALATLALALTGAAWLDGRSRPRWLVLVDRSASVPAAAADDALAEVTQAAREAGIADLQYIEFAGRAAPASASPSALATSLEPSASNLEVALQAALAAAQASPAAERPAGVVMISDGLATAGDTPRALQAMRDAGLALHWRPAGRPMPPIRVAEVLAPARATTGQALQVTLRLAGTAAGPALRARASLRDADGAVRSRGDAPAADGQATIALEAVGSGPLLVDVALEDAAGRTIDRREAAAVIDVGASAPVLYVLGAGGGPAAASVPAALAASLRRGGWALDVVPAARLESLAGALAGYRAVILDDVAVGDASERVWNALVRAVRTQGLGLLVLGGERSFARGGYRGSVLESVLPLRSEPATLEQTASVVFVVDKSGSMGEGSAGVDRFRLAQRAVVETARGLGARDAFGLVVFDVEARTLLPLTPAAEGLASVQRDWPVAPGGGTRLAPALESAAAALEGGTAARRLLVLVTDGFVDEAPLAALRERLARARVETVALAVGPDADIAALARVAGDGGVVLRVREAAELPQAMQSGVERRRARVERGAFAVVQRSALPFAPASRSDWPAVAAYHVTRPQPGAVVPLLSERGDPLLALQPPGGSRVAALTTGLGDWTPRWLAWREWPPFAGGLVDWLTGGGEQAIALALRDLPDALEIDVEQAVRADAAPAAAPRLTVTPPGGAAATLAAEAVAPGRWRARWPDAGAGLYTVTAAGAGTTLRQWHLRRAAAEDESAGLQPALPAWQAAGLVRMWDARTLARAPSPALDARPIDRSLLLLALAWFVLGVIVDRSHTDGRVWLEISARWRAALARRRGRADEA